MQYRPYQAQNPAPFLKGEEIPDQGGSHRKNPTRSKSLYSSANNYQIKIICQGNNQGSHGKDEKRKNIDISRAPINTPTNSRAMMPF